MHWIILIPLFHRLHRKMERTDVLPTVDFILTGYWMYGRVAEVCWGPRGRGVAVIIVLIVEEEVGVVRQGRGRRQGGQGARLGVPGQDGIQRHWENMFQVFDDLQKLSLKLWRIKCGLSNSLLFLRILISGYNWMFPQQQTTRRSKSTKAIWRTFPYYADCIRPKSMNRWYSSSNIAQMNSQMHCREM